MDPQQKKLPVINKITNQELQLLYGLSFGGAQNRLTIIKQALGKKKSDYLTVVAFCKHENISLDEFDIMMRRAYNSA